MAHDEFGGLTGWDLEGFHSGGDTEVWKRLGSHVITIDDDERGPITGTRFAVWAPNAQAVEVISDFNWWTGDRMRLIPGSGVWGAPSSKESTREPSISSAFRTSGAPGTKRLTQWPVIQSKLLRMLPSSPKPTTNGMTMSGSPAAKPPALTPNR